MDTKEILSDTESEARATALQARLEAAVLGKLVGESSENLEPEEQQISVSNLSSGAGEARRLARRPDTDHLKPGTVSTGEGEVLPLFNVGDRIVVERCCSFLSGNPWLDTYIYKVISIDDETGAIHCLDEDTEHHSTVSFKSKFQRVFLCPKTGNPFTETAKKLAAKEEARVVAKKEGLAGPDGALQVLREGKKGRGRPKGTKNRPKEVIMAEKQKKAEEKRTKKARRGKK
jgi:hypothetical protein